MQIRYNSLNSFLKKKFKCDKVRKIPINAGFSCPNKNGEISKTGCIFCDKFGSGPIGMFNRSIREQIEEFTSSNKGIKFIAYYQAHSNTYASVKELEEKYNIIFEYEDIVGLSLGTRPDSIAPDVFPLLDKIAKKTYLSVELGLQSIHDKSLDFLKRNHSYEIFLDTFNKLKGLNIDVVVHLIVGIPGENKDEMKESVYEMNRIKPAGVKFHLFHVLKDTELYKMYERGGIELMDRGEYIDTVVELLCELNEDIVVHRLTGDRDLELFHAPEWAIDRKRVISGIQNKMRLESLSQGCRIVTQNSKV